MSQKLDGSSYRFRVGRCRRLVCLASCWVTSSELQAAVGQVSRLEFSREEATIYILLISEGRVVTSEARFLQVERIPFSRPHFVLVGATASLATSRELDFYCPERIYFP
jgi:hypothetical protein